MYEREEVKEIKHLMSSWFNKKGTAFITLINGSSGSGKTLSLSYSLLECVKENPLISWVWVDGNKEGTTMSLYKKICTTLGGNIKSGTTATEILIIIGDLMNKKGTETLIVIDEVEKIYHNSRESPAYKFLQSLVRLDVKPRPSFFFITNEFNFMRYLNPEISGGMNEIIFNSYTSADLYEILSKRAKHCLHRWSYTEEDLARIAKEVYQTPIINNQANARHAIKILAMAADMASTQNKPLSEVLEKAFKKMRLHDYVTLFKKYHRHLQILIKTIAVMKNEMQNEAKGLSKLENPILDYQEIMNRFFKDLFAETGKSVTPKSVDGYLDILVKDRVISRFSKGRYLFVEDADNIISAFGKLEV